MSLIRRPHPDRQRGAISIIAAAGLLAVVAAAMLAVDLGNMFYTKRQLQNVADNAALSAANNPSDAQHIAADTAALNNFTSPGAHSNALTAVSGQYDFATDTFTPGGTAGMQNAVQVTVTTQEPYFFMPGSHEVTATATAARTDVAGLSMGSGLLAIDTQKSALLNAILGKLLNTSLNLDAVSYQGLANTNVRLLDLLKADASAGTLQELLNSDIALPDLLRLTATALSRSNIATADANLISTLNLLSAQVPANLHLKLADLLKLDAAPTDAALSAQINVFQLVTFAAEVANGDHFLDMPVGVNLPGLLTVSLHVTLIEPPSIAIGPAGQDASGAWRTRVHTAQARVQLDLDVGQLLGGLVHVPLYVEAAAGDAWLEKIECRTPRDDSTVTVGASTGIANIYLGEVNPDAMTNTSSPATVSEATILNVLGLVTVSTKLDVAIPGAGPTSLDFNGPFDANNTQRISGLSTGGTFSNLSTQLAQPGALDVQLLGLNLNLGSVVQPLIALLTPVFSTLDSLLVPVLSMLGIQTGYGDVTVFYLSCGAPELVR